MNEPDSSDAQGGPRACVFGPVPILTVTIEPLADADDEADAGDIHLHAGGQGFWIARLLSELGVRTVLCGAFGGETGRVVQDRIEDEGVEVRAVPMAGGNGGYVHDRRSGERVPVASQPATALTRHEVDDLYGTTLVEALEADVTVLGGDGPDSALPPDVYTRLAADLTTNDKIVVADLSGEQLVAALGGGVSLLKLSHEELARDRHVDVEDERSIVLGMRRLVEDGARNVVVTRAERPALALVDGQILTIVAPELEPQDPRGAGDSLTAGIACGLARHGDVIGALRFGAAAGAMNVTRRGLATGRRAEIERLAEHVEVREFRPELSTTA